MNAIKKILLIPCILFTTNQAKDIILEFKTAYFKPTGHTLKSIYHSSAQFGPEVTWRMTKHLHGFASLDFLTKKGHTTILHTPTRVFLMPIGLGIKVMGRVSKHARMYGGLGFQPTLVHTHDKSPYVIPKHTKFRLGGIAKVGAYIDLPYNMMLDFFFDYSALNVKAHRKCNTIIYTQSKRSCASGVLLGAGLGYRFH